jgi:hypothetical protein
MKSLSLFVILLISTALWAQKISLDAEVSATGIICSEDEIPFWMHTNTNGSLGASSNFSGEGSVKATYNLENSFLEAGTAFFYRDGVKDEFQRRDLYIKYQNNWLNVTAGSKKEAVKLNGLSATNKDFLMSSNARPLPGLLIEANNPLKISNSIGVDWGIGQYFLNDDRIVKNTLVHYKKLGLYWMINEKNSVKGTLKHYAMWGGTSPEYGKQPADFKEFTAVFVAKNTGNRVNAPGNHLGSYLLEYDLNVGFGDFSFYHEHPFEDGSGTRFANFPDGVWGLFFKAEANKYITAVLYEYIDTTDQSFYTGGSGNDSYFNHRIYKSGWTYDGLTIGLPFITPPVNNSLRAHQFGITSTIHKIDITLKTSFVQSNGTISVPYEVQQNSVYTLAKASYSMADYGQVSLLFGYDNNNLNNDIIGSGLSYQYQF